MSPKIYNAQNAKRANRAYVLRGASAQSATAKACSTTMGRAKKGGRRWSPPGGTIEYVRCRLKFDLESGGTGLWCLGVQAICLKRFEKKFGSGRPPVKKKSTKFKCSSITNSVMDFKDHLKIISNTNQSDARTIFGSADGRMFIFGKIQGVFRTSRIDSTKCCC